MGEREERGEKREREREEKQLFKNWKTRFAIEHHVSL